MAEKELKSIKFPGLEGVYVVPEGGGGATGPAGKDGITPTIGANGNWYLGDIDTQKPSRGEKGADGAAGKDGSDGYSPEATVTPINGGAKIIIKDRNGTTSANVMNGARGPKGDAGPQGPKGDPGATDFSLGITGAQVGQIAKITAVDASGKPTKWEPVDMAGGGEREWVKVGAITTEEDTTEKTWVTFSEDVDGNPLELKGVLIICKPLFNDTRTHSLGLICNNENSNRNYLLYAPVLRNTQFSTVFSEFLRVDGNNSIVNTIYNSGSVKQNGGCESKVDVWSPKDASMHMRYPMRGIKCMIEDAMLAGSTFEVWGVKA